MILKQEFKFKKNFKALINDLKFIRFLKGGIWYKKEVVNIPGVDIASIWSRNSSENNYLKVIKTENYTKK